MACTVSGVNKYLMDGSSYQDESIRGAAESRASSTYLTVPMALMVSIVSLSAGLEASTKTSSFLSLMAVERPPMGRKPNRANGTEKTVINGLMARMTVSDMVVAVGSFRIVSYKIH